MAAMGLLDEIYRLPLVPPRPASRERIGAVLRAPRASGAAGGGVMNAGHLAAEIDALYAEGRGRGS